jgi:hypothetical protein
MLYKRYKAYKAAHEGGKKPEFMSSKEAFLFVQFTRSKINSTFSSDGPEDIKNVSTGWRKEFESDRERLREEAIDKLHEIELFASENPLSREDQNETLYNYGYIDTEEYLKEKQDIGETKKEAVS